MALVFVIANGPKALQVLATRLTRASGRVIWLLPAVGLLATLFLLSNYQFSAVTLVSSALTLVITLLAIVRQRRYRPKPIVDRPVPHSLVVMTMLLILLPQIFIIPVLQARLHKPTATINSAINYLETLPKDTLIAGDPCSISDVPLYASRAVLFSCEAGKSQPRFDAGLF